MNNEFNQNENNDREKFFRLKLNKGEKIETLISELNASKIKSSERKFDEKRNIIVEIASLYEENYKLSSTIEVLSENLDKKVCQNIILEKEKERYKNEKKKLYDYFFLKVQVAQDDFLSKKTLAEIESIVDRVRILENENIELANKYQEVVNILKSERQNCVKFMRFMLLKTIQSKYSNFVNENLNNLNCVGEKNCFSTQNTFWKENSSRENRDVAVLCKLESSEKFSSEKDFNSSGFLSKQKCNRKIDFNCDTVRCHNSSSGELIVLIPFHKEKLIKEIEREFDSKAHFQTPLQLQKINQIPETNYNGPLPLKQEYKKGIQLKKKNYENSSNYQIIRIVGHRNNFEKIHFFGNCFESSKIGRLDLWNLWNIFSAIKFVEINNSRFTLEVTNNRNFENIEVSEDFGNCLSIKDTPIIEEITLNPFFEKVNFYDRDIIKISKTALNMALFYTVKNQQEISREIILKEEKNKEGNAEGTFLIKEENIVNNLEINNHDSSFSKNNLSFSEAVSTEEFSSKSSEIWFRKNKSKANQFNEKADFIANRKKSEKFVNKSLSRIPIALSNACRQSNGKKDLNTKKEIDRGSNINHGEKRITRSLSVDRKLLSPTFQNSRKESARKNEFKNKTIKGSKIPVRRVKIKDEDFDNLFEIGKENFENTNFKEEKEFKIKVRDSEEDFEVGGENKCKMEPEVKSEKENIKIEMKKQREVIKMTKLDSVIEKQDLKNADRNLGNGDENLENSEKKDRILENERPSMKIEDKNGKNEVRMEKIETLITKQRNRNLEIKNEDKRMKIRDKKIDKQDCRIYKNAKNKSKNMTDENTRVKDNNSIIEKLDAGDKMNEKVILNLGRRNNESELSVEFKRLEDSLDATKEEDTKEQLSETLLLKRTNGCTSVDRTLFSLSTQLSKNTIEQVEGKNSKTKLIFISKISQDFDSEIKLENRENAEELFESETTDELLTQDQSKTSTIRKSVKNPMFSLKSSKKKSVSKNCQNRKNNLCEQAELAKKKLSKKCESRKVKVVEKKRKRKDKKQGKKMNSKVKTRLELTSREIEKGLISDEMKDEFFFNKLVREFAEMNPRVATKGSMLTKVVNKKSEMILQRNCQGTERERSLSKAILVECEGNTETFQISSKKFALDSKKMDIASWISQAASRLRQSGQKEEEQLSNNWISKESKKGVNKVWNCVGKSSRQSSRKGEEFIRCVHPSSESSKRVSDCKAVSKDFSFRKCTQMSEDSVDDSSDLSETEDSKEGRLSRKLTDEIVKIEAWNIRVRNYLKEVRMKLLEEEKALEKESVRLLEKNYSPGNRKELTFRNTISDRCSRMHNISDNSEKVDLQMIFRDVERVTNIINNHTAARYLNRPSLV